MTTPITPQQISQLLGKFGVLFQPHDFALSRTDGLVKTWCEALSDEEASDIEQACQNLRRKLRAFPCPADVLDEIRAMRGGEVKQ